MAKKIIIIDPITRIEGHLKVELEIEGGKVVDARSSGTLFRGFEIILKGRDPKDAQHLTQRVCGVCPVCHATAASLTLESAFRARPPSNARIIRNLVLGTNFLQSHILHFYLLVALDYFVGPENPPFIPRFKGDYRLSKQMNKDYLDHYLKAMEVRRKIHEMTAIFAGRMPQHITFVPGGVTEKPTVDKIASFLWRLREIIDFIEKIYLPDVLKIGDVYKDYSKIGKGYGNLLAYGVFDLDDRGRKKLFKRGRFTDGKIENMDWKKITEDVRYSWYEREISGRKPRDSDTFTAPRKAGAYSWLKSPRYAGKPHELGPLARMWINGDYRKGISVMDRHIARALEAKKIARAMEEWVLQLRPERRVYVSSRVPKNAQGIGLTEGPRGALGHWIKITNSKIERYQIVTPTNWNCSPRDDRDKPGPMERALIGTSVADPENPIELMRIIRSYDPCLACSVHLIEPGRSISEFRVC
ncbi:MAG: nickel-dependent hydrogenase large subunit [bacterium]